MGQSQSFSGAAVSGAVTSATMDNFHTFIQFTAAAYCNTDPLQISTSISCSENACPDIQSHDTHIVTTLDISQGSSGGYIALDNTAQTIVVAFRGASNIDNWITNLNAGLVDFDLCPGCKVHNGFADSWDEIAQTVMAVVPGLRSAHPSYKVVTTGYSLGAALATLSAAYLRQSMGTPVDTYLYGSPRVGNEAFVAAFNSLPGQTFRVTHWDDPVPRLPGHLLGYYHVDTEFWLSRGNAKETNYTPEDVKVCQGKYNTNCNSGTMFTDLDVDAHKYYFQRVSACKP